MRFKKKILKLLEFKAEQYKKVKDTIQINKSIYHIDCWRICLLQEETLRHLIYCIEEGFDLEEYKKDNIGNKMDWFGIK